MPHTFLWGVTRRYGFRVNAGNLTRTKETGALREQSSPMGTDQLRLMLDSSVRAEHGFC